MARRGPRPAPETPALIDLRVLFVAAVVASPAAYRASQGLLTIDQALTRFLLVALACAGVSMLVQSLWPMVAGSSPEPAVAGAGEPSDSADGPLVSPRPE